MWDKGKLLAILFTYTDHAKMDQKQVTMDQKQVTMDQRQVTMDQKQVTMDASIGAMQLGKVVNIYHWIHSVILAMTITCI